MQLNFLEFLGVLMIFFAVSITVVTAYYLIKDAISAWKRNHRKKCPFCGVYLHGYQYDHRGVKFDARFCSRCGKPLNEESARCQTCMLYGKDCNGASGNCSSAIIKEKKNDHDR